MNPFTLNMRAVVTATAALALGTLLVAAYVRGKQDQTNDTQRDNIEAGETANDAALTWRECVDAGGVYDFASGKCSRRP